MSFFTSGDAISGSIDNDFILALTANVISGGAGSDLILGDFGGQLVTSYGTTRATAFDLDSSIDFWSVAASPVLGNDAIPTVTIGFAPASGERGWFSVSLAAGQSITIDTDTWMNFTDTFVQIVNASGTVLASDDDSATTEGGAGSISNYDSLLTFTAPSSGTYFVQVYRYFNNPFNGNEQMLVNISVSGHAVGAAAHRVNGDSISGGDGVDALFGMGGADTLEGGAGDDRLDGGIGGDTMIGGAGSDVYWVDHPNDLVVETVGLGSFTDAGGFDRVEATVSVSLAGNGSQYVEQLLLLGTGNIDGAGNGLANSITGNTGNNAISGGGGNDYIRGNAGDDTLTGGDGVDLLAGEIGADILRGDAGADSLYGGDGADSLLGGGDNDSLDGGLGADTMIGGAGDDIYYVDDAGDLALEVQGGGSHADSGGFDVVYSTVSYSLQPGTYVEGLTLLGTQAANGFGNASNNDLAGNNIANFLFGSTGTDYLRAGGGNDTLNGGDGADTMEGGFGDDLFIVDDAGDVVSESLIHGVWGGYDTVNSSVSYSIASTDPARVFIENLTLTGTADTDGWGNAFANRLVGNAGNNVLRGAGGHDTIIGGTGADRLHGQRGDDHLNGGDGADTLKGGEGNDTYVVDNAADRLVETTTINSAVDAGGHDLVLSSVTINLFSAPNGAQFVEDIALTGTGAINATGNALDNMIQGNVAANALRGAGGDDTIRGGQGADVLSGGAGGDLFVFADGETLLATPDRITDFSQADGDRMDLSLMDARTTIVGNDTFAWIDAGPFTQVAGQLRYVQQGGNTRIEGDTNGDGAADFAIQLDGLVVLTAADFVL